MSVADMHLVKPQHNHNTTEVLPVPTTTSFLGLIYQYSRLKSLKSLIFAMTLLAYVKAVGYSMVTQARNQR